MGRDFTPREMVWVDDKYGFSKSKTTMTVQGTGEEVVLYDPESEMSKKYPHLSLLLDGFADLYEASLHNEELRKRLEIAEAELDGIICEDLSQKDKKESVIDDSHIKEIVHWYAGALDPNFYYNEENNRRFRMWLLSGKIPE